MLPFAIDFSTLVYGRGSVVMHDNKSSDHTSTIDTATKKERTASFSYVSAMSPNLLETSELFESSIPPETSSWTTYIEGTVFQYLQDLPKGAELRMQFCIAGDVPLGEFSDSIIALQIKISSIFFDMIGQYVHRFQCFDCNQPKSQTVLFYFISNLLVFRIGSIF